MPPVDDPKKSTAAEWARYVGGMASAVVVGVMTGYLICVMTYGERIVRVETNLASLTESVQRMDSVLWSHVAKEDRGGGGQ